MPIKSVNRFLLTTLVDELFYQSFELMTNYNQVRGCIKLNKNILKRGGKCRYSYSYNDNAITFTIVCFISRHLDLIFVW